jgi:hypothetical protein
MLRSYQSYLEYKEMRRRIERKLKGSSPLLIHMIIYAVINGLIWYSALTPIYDPVFSQTPFAPGFVTVIWGIVLLAHGVWQRFHSGLREGTRGRIIEQEMRKLLEESYSDIDQDDFFQIHQLLDEDVKQRAGFALPIALVTMLNASIWLLWAVNGARYFAAYGQFVLLLMAASVLIVGGGASNLLRRTRRERRRRGIQVVPIVEKPKRVAALQLNEDGELDELITDEWTPLEKLKQ